MPLFIDVLSIGEDLYEHIQTAIDAVNQVQGEFRFQLPPNGLRDFAFQLRRENYTTDEVFESLKQYRDRRDQVCAIGFLNGPLSSKKLNNLFGSHIADDGLPLAVATTHGYAQFVSDIQRFYQYYLVRYAMTFVAPYIKAHPTSDCFFDTKLLKSELRLSMKSGRVCDDCLRKFDNPPNLPSAWHLRPVTPEAKAALENLRKLVSRQLPYSLIMKGGGIKGLAFAGALKELEKFYSFDVFAGTSAGAITAIALAAGHTPSEIEAILQRKNFVDFLDGSTLLRPYYLMFSGGLYLGNAAQDWIESDLLRTKIAREGDITMKDLPLTRDGSRAVLYACRSRGGTIVFDSEGDLSGVIAAFAARCSMSIPLFFVPQAFQGERIYDGGLRHNFPVARFILDNPEKPFLALYLKDERRRTKRSLLPLELYDIWMDGDELKLVDSHKEHIVIIDPDPIGTTDFSLNQMEKDFLVKVGRAAALRFLWALNTLDGPTKKQVEDAESEVSQIRNQLCSWRGRLSLRFRRWRQVASVMLPFVVLVGAIWERALIARLLSRLVYLTGL